MRRVRRMEVWAIALAATVGLARLSLPSAALAQPDTALAEVAAKLDLLLAGELPETESVQALFGISLDEYSKIGARIAELEAQIGAHKKAISGMRRRQAELNAQEQAEPALAEPPRPDAEASQTVVEPSPTPPRSARGVAEDAIPVEAAAAGAAADADPKQDTDEAGALLRAQTAVRQREYEAARLARQARSEARAREREELAVRLPQTVSTLEVAEKRLRYLRAFSKYTEKMTDASRRTLPSLGAPREAIRSHAAQLSALAESMAGAANRAAVLGQRVSSGAIVGFVSEQRALGEELAALSEAFAQESDRLATLASELVELAGSLELRGRKLRAAIFHSVMRSDRQAVFDELFLDHLRSQRRLRKSVSNVLVTAGEETLKTLRRESDELLADQRRVASTSDARRLAEAGVEHRLKMDTLLSQESGGTNAWALAFENELVTVLSEQASANARTGAYGFSREMIEDVQSEIGLAWDQARDAAASVRAAIPNSAALLTAPEGQAVIGRLAGILGLLGLLVLARRETPLIVVLLVKSLARAPGLRSKLGTLVRWSGLFQAIVPALLSLATLTGVVWIIGRETAIGRALNVLVLPWLLYSLGRQLLLGATRRIAPGRPALIEIAPDSLDRLRRTYATLGVVVALAYMLDGIARVAVGAGRVVSLIDGFVLVWVVLWALWEAIRWRVPLATRWAELGSEPRARAPQSSTEPSSGQASENAVARWMGGSRLGFLLSPLALTILLAAPIAGTLRGLVSGTGLAQSFRARMLRRRSEKSEGGAKVGREPLPQAYLEAFPLFPALGEDDALIVSREGILDEVLAQWEHWKETRVDGSLAIVGEKGAGKTTLAAQLARKVGGSGLVQHTVRGKPTTRTELMSELAEALGHPGVTEVEEMSRLLCSEDDRVVLLDEAHNVFLRQVDGFGAYDALVDLVNATSNKVFWVVVFNNFTWRFLNESRRRAHYFRKVLPLPKWTTAEIQKLIYLRNRRTNFELRFDALLLADPQSDSGSLQLVEEAEGYFRLLWESSNGNPRVATHLWLSSLRPVSENTLAVGLFPERKAEDLSGLGDDLVFCLAAICQHENLSRQELANVLNLSYGFAQFSIQFLLEAGYIDAKDATAERYTLAPDYYHAVLRMLRSRHLLFD